jgi:hypothetical protein
MLVHNIIWKRMLFMAVMYKVAVYLMGTTGSIGKLCIVVPTSFLRHYLSCMQATKWTTQKHQKWRCTHHTAGTCDDKVADLQLGCLVRNLAGTTDNLSEVLCGFHLYLQENVTYITTSSS